MLWLKSQVLWLACMPLIFIAAVILLSDVVLFRIGADV